MADEDAYRLWVSDDGTLLVRLWSNGEIEAALRAGPGAIWGPPITLKEEPA